MHNMNEIETYLAYHRDNLMRQAEQERQIRQAARSIDRISTAQPGLRIVFGFTRTPDTRFGRIVIEGELK